MAARACSPSPINPASSKACTQKCVNFSSRRTKVATARTLPPTGVAAVCRTLSETPTDSWSSPSKGRMARAAATSISAIIREVANTSGKASLAINAMWRAVSSRRTTRVASAEMLSFMLHSLLVAVGGLVARQAGEQFLGIAEHELLAGGDVLQAADEPAGGRARVSVQLEHVGARARVVGVDGEDHSLRPSARRPPPKRWRQCAPLAGHE